VAAAAGESAGGADRQQQQRVMVIGNNNVFEVGSRILAVILLFTLLHQFGSVALRLFTCYV